MKSILWTCLAFLLLVAAPASAQVHPCDGVAATTFKMQSGSVTVLICWEEKDTQGNPVIANSWGVSIDGGPRTIFAMARITSTPNAAGFSQYQGIFSLPKGMKTVSVDVGIDDGLGGTLTAAAPSVQWQGQGPPPRAPKNATVKPTGT